MISSKKQSPWHLSTPRASIYSLNYKALITHFMQCFTKLIGTRSRTTSTTNTFQTSNDYIYRHSFYETGNTLQITITSTPKCNFFHNSIFYINFDVRAACALSLIGIYHYYSPSSGFMFVYTVCTSSNSSRRSIILSKVSRCSGVTSFKSLGM